MSRAHEHVCWICGRAIALETCKIDEVGYPIHEECYVARVALDSESTRLSKAPPPSTTVPPTLRRSLSRLSATAGSIPMPHHGDEPPASAGSVRRDTTRKFKFAVSR